MTFVSKISGPMDKGSVSTVLDGLFQTCRSFDNNENIAIYRSVANAWAKARLSRPLYREKMAPFQWKCLAGVWNSQSSFSRIFIFKKSWSKIWHCKHALIFSPKMSRWTLTCSPWVCRPSGSCVTCCLLEKAEREWYWGGTAPSTRAIWTPRILPRIFCAFLRDSACVFVVVLVRVC